MRLMQEFNFSGKTVLLRCDFNVSSQNGTFSGSFRLLNHLETIRYLMRQKAKIILLAHWETNQGEIPSLKILEGSLEKIIKTKIVFLKNGFAGRVKKRINKQDPGAVLLLENLRYNKGEKAADKGFARKLAGFGDVFVQDAFSVCHRKHASVVELPKILPSFAGLALQKEVSALDKILKEPQRPFTFIIGGAKIADKIKPLNKLFSICDNIIFGGRLIEEILAVKGIVIGKQWPAEAVVKAIKSISITSPKMHMPIDVLVSPDLSGQVYVRKCAPGNVRKEEQIFDIADGSIDKFKSIIQNSKTILWSGVLGLVENELFANGTEAIALAIARNKDCFKVVGGGDTVAFIRKMGLEQGFSHLSSGGSALTIYIAEGTLPGIAVLI